MSLNDTRTVLWIGQGIWKMRSKHKAMSFRLINIQVFCLKTQWNIFSQSLYKVLSMGEAKQTSKNIFACFAFHRFNQMKFYISAWCACVYLFTSWGMFATNKGKQLLRLLLCFSTQFLTSQYNSIQDLHTSTKRCFEYLSPAELINSRNVCVCVRACSRVCESVLFVIDVTESLMLRLGRCTFPPDTHTHWFWNSHSIPSPFQLSFFVPFEMLKILRLTWDCYFVN